MAGKRDAWCMLIRGDFCFQGALIFNLTIEPVLSLVQATDDLPSFFLLQAKPIYGGWLLLAPDGTDFDNPVHRSRVRSSE